ncbi:MAG: gluconate 2-dehydrogenase subunit 3 family protein [Deltaproteobacteria bacterium]|nr:gluconate 2-dehydrogenase subunit 3 family protein [Deltaproteobacteria bacterium]
MSHTKKTKDQVRRALTRREFLELGAALSAFLAGCSKPAQRTTAPSESAALPTLAGAPDTHEGQTIAAFVDTIVPGKHRDPDGSVGALDVGAGAVFFDPRLPAKDLVPLIVLALDSFAQESARRDFIELKPAKREEVLAEALEKIPQLGLAVQLAKLAYYSSKDGGELLGYPGANWGYVDDDNLSFNREMAPPHPKVLRGGEDAGHYE